MYSVEDAEKGHIIYGKNVVHPVVMVKVPK